jgi:phosphate starvation-inducible PhoH-like protein
LEYGIPLRSQEEERILLGLQDGHARALRQRYGVELVTRQGALKLIGEVPAIDEARQRVETVLDLVRQGRDMSADEVRARLTGDLVRKPNGPLLASAIPPSAPSASEGDAAMRPVHRPAWSAMSSRSGESDERLPHVVLPTGVLRPQTPGQARYMDAIRANAITFGIGPAGTGKTFLAVAMAVEALRRGEFRRLVLVRPAVEAGEKLGFLPGDFQAKINPYLRPLYDALNDLLDPDATKRYFENDVLEVLPLAFMRGRTLNSSFIILDEAQNTTVSQMMMFLTRMGYGSKIVVTGDDTQIDLPRGARSGLIDVRKRLQGIPGIAFSILERGDIVRHPLVQRIVEAYGDLSRARSAEDEDAR